MARMQNGDRDALRGDLGASGGQRIVDRSFCAAEGIGEPSIYAWRKRLRTGKTNGARTVRKEARHEKGMQQQRQSVRSLQLLDAPTSLEIVHPLGYRIHVTGDVSPVALRRVIKALDERAAR